MTSILMRNRANRSISRVQKIQKPRSVFPLNWYRKQTMNCSYLTPITMQEVEPGDTFNINMTNFMRLATQITAPIDNLIVNTYFFFVPYRLVWDNFVKQHGERENPDDSIDYITPTITSGESGFGFNTIYDYMGGINVTAKGNKITALPFRAYNKIWNEYFRDETLQDSVTVKKDDSDDDPSLYTLLKKGKARDYFTDCTPTIQKGEPVSLPLGTTAPVRGNGMTMGFTDGTKLTGMYPSVNTENNYLFNTNTYGVPVGETIGAPVSGDSTTNRTSIGLTTDATKSGLIADLSDATASTIQALRLAIHTQELLENDMRQGTRYTEQLQHRYGVLNPDLRLQRCQYLGGTYQPFFTNPVVQTSGTSITGQSTAQGNIAGYGTTGDSGNVIRASFGEFGCIIGLACVTAIPQYQFGTHRKWKRFERFDYMYPEFVGLSDQAVKNSEIYTQDNDVVDQETGEEINDKTFGYIGRYDELRYSQNEICGELRSDYPTTLDYWHYAEKFDELPNLNEDFMQDKTDEIVKRSLAVQYEDVEQETLAPQIIADFEFSGAVYRCLPAKAKPMISSNCI